MSKEVDINKLELGKAISVINSEKDETLKQYPERIITKIDKNGVVIKDGKYLSKPMPILSKETMKKRIECAARKNPEIFLQWKQYAQSCPQSTLAESSLHRIAHTSVDNKSCFIGDFER